MRHLGGVGGWLAGLCVAAAIGCDGAAGSDLPGDRDVPAGEIAPSEAAFASPQGIALARGLAFVANPDLGYVGQSLAWGPGFVTVVRLSDGAVLQRVPVAAANPQSVASAGDRVVVLCSGPTTFDGSVVRPAGPGSVAVLDAAEAEAGRTALVREIPLPASAAHPMVGYPSSMALSPDGRRAWLGSGTAPALFLVDLDAGTVLRGAYDPVALGDLDAQDTVVVRPGPGGTLLAGRFENDEVRVLDAEAGTPHPSFPDPFPVGRDGQADGVLDLAVRDGGHPDVYVLLGLASAVASIDTARGADGIDSGFARTGTYPNRLLRDGERLLVLNSGDNNVTALDLATGQALGTVAVLPPGTNPYDLAAWKDGDRAFAAITGQQSNALYVVDLDRAEIVREVR